MNTTTSAILFFRHGRLQSPFDHYEHLTFAQLRDLANEVFKPLVDGDFIQSQAPSITAHLIKGKPLHIYVSPSDRAQQTLAYLTPLLGEIWDVTSETLHELREVSFSLENVYSDASSHVDLGVLNRVILQGMAEGHPAVEPYTSIQSRAQIIQTRVFTSQQPNTIFLTHDFFLRVLELTFTTGSVPTQLSPEELLATTRNSYLEGFVLDQTFTHIHTLKNI